jgi:uncharacterized protein YjbJ (UPF0337 family)
VDFKTLRLAPHDSATGQVITVFSDGPTKFYSNSGNSQEEDLTMNWDRVQGQWKQLKGKIKTKWGKLTDDDLDVIAGQKDQLIGKIQERYGLKKEEAQNQVEEWNATLAEENAAQTEAERKRGMRRAG